MTREEIIYVATNKGVIVPTINDGFAFMQPYKIQVRTNDKYGIYLHIREPREQGNGEGYIFLPFETLGKDWFLNEGEQQ